MKKAIDITVEVLKDIRGELQQLRGETKGVRAELQQLRGDTNARLDAVRGEVHDTGHDLGRRIVESELRTATALTDVAGTVRDMTGVLRAGADLRPRLEKCEQEIGELKRRLPEAS
jgi:hypothetical protein